MNIKSTDKSNPTNASIQKARASVESEKMKLEVLRQHVPLTPQFDHLHRYEAMLERNFDRALNQL